MRLLLTWILCYVLWIYRMWYCMSHHFVKTTRNAWKFMFKSFHCQLAKCCTSNQIGHWNNHISAAFLHIGIGYLHLARIHIRPQGIMLQIFIIILFRISSKIASLCSLIFPKSTDYSHYSQLYCHTFTGFLHFCNQNVQQYFVVAYTM